MTVLLETRAVPLAVTPVDKLDTTATTWRALVYLTCNPTLVALEHKRKRDDEVGWRLESGRACVSEYKAGLAPGKCWGRAGA